MTAIRMAACCVLGLILVVGGADASTLAHEGEERRDLDLTASAQPSVTRPNATDTAIGAVSSPRPVVKADAVATSSATCDLCTGDSATLQILYLSRSQSADLDNSALAWAQCRDCGATALSVQVVVLRGWPTVTPNNRAMAVNAACENCRTTAAAFQLVVVAPRVRRLSPESVQGLQTWFDEQAAALRASNSAPPQRRRADDAPDPDGARALASLEGLVNNDLGSVTAVSDVTRTE